MATTTEKLDAGVNQKRNAAEQEATEKKYTLFASGLNHGGRDVELKNKNTSTDIAIIFDVVERHSYSVSVEKTQYATENKVTFSDHAVIADGKFSFTARVNSSPMYLIQNNYIDRDTDPNNPVQSKRPQKTLEFLREMISKRGLITLVAEDMILENYICTSMEAVREGSEGDSLAFNLEFEEFRTFTLGKTVLTNYTDPKKSTPKQKGAVNSSADEERITVYTKQSKLVSKSEILHTIADRFEDSSSYRPGGTLDPTTNKIIDLNGNVVPENRP